MSRLEKSAQRGAVRLLRVGARASRAIGPMGSGRVGTGKVKLDRRLARGIAWLESSGLSRRESGPREQVRLNPDSSISWRELGFSLHADGRAEEAVEALLRAAELGPELRAVTAAFVNRPQLAQIAASDQNIGRMVAIAERKPDHARTQLLVGTFLLDQGKVLEGRARVRRGYSLMDDSRLRDLDYEAEGTLPSFLVLGPPKSGTTSLFALLREHPQVVAPPRKELQYWMKAGERSIEGYRAYFAPLPRGGELVTGEASPNNHASAAAANAAREWFPDVRTIILRRDPVARAYSHYQMSVRSMRERRSFEEVVEHEISVIGDRPPQTVDGLPNGRLQNLLRSCILPSIKLWTEAIGPDQVAVVDSRYLSSDRPAAVTDIIEYLGLRPAELPDLENRNVHRYPPIRPQTADRLRHWFEPHEAELDKFLVHHPRTFRGSSTP